MSESFSRLDNRLNDLTKKKFAAMSQQLTKSSDALSTKVCKQIQEVSTRIQAAFVQMLVSRSSTLALVLGHFWYLVCFSMDEKLASAVQKVDENSVKIMAAIQDAMARFDTAEQAKKSFKDISVQASSPTVVSCDVACQTTDDELCPPVASQGAASRPSAEHSAKTSRPTQLKPARAKRAPSKPTIVLRNAIRSRQLLARSANTTSNNGKSKLLKAASNQQPETAEPSDAKKRSDMATTKSVPKKLKLVIPEDDLDDFAPYFIGKEASTFLF